MALYQFERDEEERTHEPGCETDHHGVKQDAPENSELEKGQPGLTETKEARRSPVSSIASSADHRRPGLPPRRLRIHTWVGEIACSRGMMCADRRLLSNERRKMNFSVALRPHRSSSESK